jgi:hypothetical protein
MHLASPPGPAHVAVSSDNTKMSFSAARFFAAAGGDRLSTASRPARYAPGRTWISPFIPRVACSGLLQ